MLLFFLFFYISYSFSRRSRLCRWRHDQVKDNRIVGHRQRHFTSAPCRCFILQWHWAANANGFSLAQAQWKRAFAFEGPFKLLAQFNSTFSVLRGLEWVAFFFPSASHSSKQGAAFKRANEIRASFTYSDQQDACVPLMFKDTQIRHRQAWNDDLVFNLSSWDTAFKDPLDVGVLHVNAMNFTLLGIQ